MPHSFRFFRTNTHPRPNQESIDAFQAWSLHPWCACSASSDKISCSWTHGTIICIMMTYHVKILDIMLFIYRVSQKKHSYKIFGLEIMLFTCSQTLWSGLRSSFTKWGTAPAFTTACKTTMSASRWRAWSLVQKFYKSVFFWDTLYKLSYQILQTWDHFLSNLYGIITECNHQYSVWVEVFSSCVHLFSLPMRNSAWPTVG